MSTVKQASTKTYPEEGRRFTRQDLLREYRNAERAMLKEVFEDSYSENLKTYDLVDHLDHMAQELPLWQLESFRRLMGKGGLRGLGQCIAALTNGERGEALARNALRWLRTDFITVDNAFLEFDGMAEEVDKVVITPKGVFIVEVKYSKARIEIDEQGMLRGPSRGSCKTYSVGERMRAKEYVLRESVESEAGVELGPSRIKCMLLFANSEHEVDDRFGRIETCRCGDIAYRIEEYDGGCEDLTYEQMERVAEAIRRRMIEPTFPAEVDVDAMQDDLASVMRAVGELSPRSDLLGAADAMPEPEAPVRSVVLACDEEDGDSLLQTFLKSALCGAAAALCLAGRPGVARLARNAIRL